MIESKEQLETLLSDYVDGNLADDQVASVEAYLQANPGVRDAVNRLMIDSEALRSLPRVNAPYDFSDDVRGQLERDLLLDDSMSSYPRGRRLSPVLLTTAAMLMLSLGVGSVAYWVLANRPATFLDVASNAPAPGGGSATRENESRDRVADSAMEPVDDLPAPTAPTTARTAHPPMAESFAARSVAAREMPVTKAVLPPDVAELIVDSPRYHRRARAIVIDADQAMPASETVEAFIGIAGIRAETLSYDATRNRALARPSQPLADASSQGQTQTSGVLSNVAPDPTLQALASGPLQPDLPEPQVLMAVGLTDAQADALQQSLQEQLGESGAIAYEVIEVRQHKAEAKAGNELGKVLPEADRAGAEFAKDQLAPATQPVLINVGDQLVVTLTDPDASNLKTRHDVTVDADGMIQLPMLERVKAGAMTIASLQKSIADAYINRNLIRQPIVEIDVPGRFSVTSADAKQALHVEDEKLKFLDKVAADPGERSDLIDIYLVVRGQRVEEAPTTAPATTAPATQPG